MSRALLSCPQLQLMGAGQSKPEGLKPEWTSGKLIPLAALSRQPLFYDNETKEFCKRGLWMAMYRVFEKLEVYCRRITAFH
jgi:hypothetical protein